MDNLENFLNTAATKIHQEDDSIAYVAVWISCVPRPFNMDYGVYIPNVEM